MYALDHVIYYTNSTVLCRVRLRCGTLALVTSGQLATGAGTSY